MQISYLEAPNPFAFVKFPYDSRKTKSEPTLYQFAAKANSTGEGDEGAGRTLFAATGRTSVLLSQTERPTKRGQWPR